MEWFGTIEKVGGRAFLRLPSPPPDVWGERGRYNLAGTVAGAPWRGTAGRYGDSWGLPLGPTFLRGTGLEVGHEVEVKVGLEGPQIDTLAEDLRASLLASPEALRRFDDLTTHSRKNYLRWIDEAKRPETRAARIVEMVRLLLAGSTR